MLSWTLIGHLLSEHERQNSLRVGCVNPRPLPLGLANAASWVRVFWLNCAELLLPTVFCVSYAEAWLGVESVVYTVLSCGGWWLGAVLCAIFCGCIGC